MHAEIDLWIKIAYTVQLAVILPVYTCGHCLCSTSWSPPCSLALKELFARAG